MSYLQEAREGRPLVRLNLLIAFFSLLGVATVALVDGGRSSPGALSGVHGQLPELQGRLGCAQCHGGWFSSMAKACLDCHEPIAQQLSQGRGLHGRLGEAGRRCAECHSDHHGEGFALVGKHSFARAGVPDPGAFDHGLVGFQMDGRHLELACSACHEHAEAALLPQGAQRFLGLSQSCASCHDDPHRGALRGSCTDCHTQRSFDEHVAARHAEHLPLIGGHAGVGCRDCHAADGPHALETLRGPLAQPPARACLDCHESPHGAAFLRGTARLAGERLEASCRACHAHEHDTFRDERLDLSPRQHAFTGFTLEAPHADLGCAQCHDPVRATFAERHPGRGADSCAACHGDPHGGQFDQGPFAAQGCVACHDRQAFEPHAFGPELHARAAFPLTDSHLAADCDACHQVPGPGMPRTFRGTPVRCESCHADAHGGFFGARAGGSDPLTQSDCARCHQATHFSDVPEAAFDHGAWTGFPILGAHLEEGCSACHQRSEAPDTTGRTLGRVSELFGPVPPIDGPHAVGQACATCHADPHAGIFDRPGLPVLVAERSGCARCHGESSFRELPRGFDHGLWTGFALDGAHARASCSACHPPLRPADERGRTWQAAKGTRCADCHADAHAGQFEVAGRTDCASCHKDTHSFRRLAFDHDWDSRFPLEGAHRALDCAACHRPTRIGTQQVVRYRPMGTACTDCHGAQVGPLRQVQGERR